MPAAPAASAGPGIQLQPSTLSANSFVDSSLRRATIAPVGCPARAIPPAQLQQVPGDSNASGSQNGPNDRTGLPTSGWRSSPAGLAPTKASGASSKPGRVVGRFGASMPRQPSSPIEKQHERTTESPATFQHQRLTVDPAPLEKALSKPGSATSAALQGKATLRFRAGDAPGTVIADCAASSHPGTGPGSTSAPEISGAPSFRNAAPASIPAASRTSRQLQEPPTTDVPASKPSFSFRRPIQSGKLQCASSEVLHAEAQRPHGLSFSLSSSSPGPANGPLKIGDAEQDAVDAGTIVPVTALVSGALTTPILKVQSLALSLQGTDPSSRDAKVSVPQERPAVPSAGVYYHPFGDDGDDDDIAPAPLTSAKPQLNKRRGIYPPVATVGAGTAGKRRKAGKRRGKV